MKTNIIILCVFMCIDYIDSLINKNDFYDEIVVLSIFHHSPHYLLYNISIQGVHILSSQNSLHLTNMRIQKNKQSNSSIKQSP
jgi:hypothetical protein